MGETWTEGVMSDGACILRDGQPVRIEDVLETLNRFTRALEFYANPAIYKPHPHGPAFDRRGDLYDIARTALSKGEGS